MIQIQGRGLYVDFMEVGGNTCLDAHLMVYAATMRAMSGGLFEVQGFLLCSTFLVFECMCACVHIRYTREFALGLIYMHQHLCGCKCTCVYACLCESVHVRVHDAHIM